jgi:hypothetical protein
MKESKDKSLIFQNPKDLMMFYHTSTRNVGLFTSISLAILSYSRFYRGKSKLYSSGLVVISTIFVLISLLINLKLYNLLIEYSKLEEYSYINNWIIINKIIFGIQYSLILFSFYTFFRLFFNKSF